MPLIDVPTVHAVTDTAILLDLGFLVRAGGVFEALGGRGAVHLRGPGLSGRALYELAAELRHLQDDSGCHLVINDRPDVAAAVGAWGVQLTSRSVTVNDAAKAFPTLRIGASVHALADAADAKAAGANWVVAGNVYRTATHPDREPKGTEFLRDVTGAGLPVIAIGGVSPERAAELVATGVHGIAAISGIWHADDPASAARKYLSSVRA